MSEVEEVKKKVDVFDFLNNITYDKQYIFDEGTQDAYNPYIVGMGLMQHQDTILLANECNKKSSGNKLFHHDFLFYSISKGKRYRKWAKANKEDEELIEYIMTKYVVNRENAKQYLKLVDDEQKQTIIDLMNAKGGRK